ncbi:MAG: hypothetical protein R2827_05385 [Bdellovibrionales bacterium]
MNQSQILAVDIEKGVLVWQSQFNYNEIKSLKLVGGRLFINVIEEKDGVYDSAFEKLIEVKIATGDIKSISPVIGYLDNYDIAIKDSNTILGVNGKNYFCLGSK